MGGGGSAAAPPPAAAADGPGLRLSDAHVQRMGRVNPAGVKLFLLAIAAAAAK